MRPVSSQCPQSPRSVNFQPSNVLKSHPCDGHGCKSPTCRLIDHSTYLIHHKSHGRSFRVLTADQDRWIRYSNSSQSTLQKPSKVNARPMPTADSSTIGIALSILRYPHRLVYDYMVSELRWNIFQLVLDSNIKFEGNQTPHSCIDMQVIYWSYTGI